MLVFCHLTQPLALRHLKMERTDDDEDGHRHEANAEQRNPRPEPTLVPVRPGLHRTLPAGRVSRFSFMVTMRVGLGTSMPKVPRAIDSKRRS